MPKLKKLLHLITWGNIYKCGGNIYKCGAIFINGDIYIYGATFINGGDIYKYGGQQL